MAGLWQANDEIPHATVKVPVLTKEVGDQHLPPSTITGPRMTAASLPIRARRNNAIELGAGEPAFNPHPTQPQTMRLFFVYRKAAMNQHLNPHIAAALAPFLHRPKPLQSFHYVLNGVPLDCEIEWERGEPATHSEPGHPDSAILWHAKVGDTDIAEILSDEQREEIETAFLNQPGEAP